MLEGRQKILFFFAWLNFSVGRKRDRTISLSLKLHSTFCKFINAEAVYFPPLTGSAKGSSGQVNQNSSSKETLHLTFKRSDAALANPPPNGPQGAGDKFIFI